ncbi:MAG: SH3 domain-containing protein, partial [Chloroflexota bacterium]
MKLIKTLWFQPNKPRLMMLILFTALFTAGCVMPVLPSTDDGAINAALSVVIDDEDQVAVVDINPTINVRLEPTFAAEVLGVLNAGDEVQILETDATGAWHRVRTLGPGVQIGEADTSGTLVGWIFIEVVAQDGLSAPDVATADTTEAVASAQTDASDSAAGDTSTTEVGADATIIATTEIVLAPTPTFTPPATPTFTPPPTVPPAPPTPTPPSVPLVITEPENMNIRWGPSTEYAVAAIVTQGSTFQIVAYSPDGAWYQIIVPEISEPVWIYSGLTRIVGPTAGLRRLTEDEIPPAFRIVTATFTPVTGSVAPAATPTFTPPPTVYYTPSPTFTPPIYPTPTFTPPPQVAAPDAPAAPAVQAASAPVVSAPPPSGGGFFGYGIQAHLLGSDAGRAIEATNDIGFGWLKQQVQWKLYERSQGSVNLGSLQGIVAGAQSRGINVLFSVVGAPDWAREANFDGSVDGPPADPQSFANFVGRMAGTFCGSGLKAIEIWNEQNLHYEWGNRPLDPVEYMNLLRPAYASIKAACPSMLVISGALTPAGDNGGLARDDFAYLEAMYQNGLANYADGI